MSCERTGAAPSGSPPSGGWRLSARLVGGLATTWWCVAVIAGVISGGGENDLEGVTWESVGVVGLVMANTCAYALAWVSERLGSRLLVSAGASFCVFAAVSAGRNHLFAMVVSGLPFILSGALWWRAELAGKRRGGERP